MYTKQDFQTIADKIADDHSVVQVDFYLGEFVPVRTFAIVDFNGELDYVTDIDSTQVFEGFIMTSDAFTDSLTDLLPSRRAFAASLAYFAYEAYLNR